MSDLHQSIKEAVELNFLVAKEHGLSENGINILNKLLIKYSKPFKLCEDYWLATSFEWKISNFDLKSDKEYYITNHNNEHRINRGRFADSRKAIDAIRRSLYLSEPYKCKVYWAKDFKEVEYNVNINILPLEDEKEIMKSNMDICFEYPEFK